MKKKSGLLHHCRKFLSGMNITRIVQKPLKEDKIDIKSIA